MGRSQSKAASPLPPEVQPKRRQSNVATVTFMPPAAAGSSGRHLTDIAQQNFRRNTSVLQFKIDKASFTFERQEYQPEVVRVFQDTTLIADKPNAPMRFTGERPNVNLAKVSDTVTSLSLAKVTEKGLKAKESKHAEILRCTPTWPRPAIRMEDTFWSEKRRLVPIYDRMLELDQRATNAPSHLSAVPEELVTYLVSEARNDVEKIRVLLYWIADHILFDLDRAAAPQSPRSVLKSGVAGVPGFNEAFAYLCSLANLQCEIVTGTCKSGDYFPGLEQVESDQEGFALKHAHAWCRLRLEDRWFYVDPAWVSGGIEKGEYVKQWEEQWFFPEPDFFLRLHLPLVRDNEGLHIDLAKQIENKEKYEDMVSWERTVALEPVCAGFGIKPISHNQNVITCKMNEVLLKFSCKEKNLTFATSLRHIDGRDYSQLNTLTYAVDGGFHVFVLCPSRGRFKLDIRCIYTKAGSSEKARLFPEDANKEEQCIRIASYLIEATGSIKNPTLPTFTIDGRWGLSDECYRAGLSVDGNQSALREAKDGRTEITLILPTAGWCPVAYRLHDTKHTDVSQYVYGDKQGCILTLFVVCPQPDYFILEVWLKSNTNSNNFDLCSRFLIRSYRSAKLYPSTMQPEVTIPSGRSPSFPVNPQSDMWGLTEYALDLGISSVEPDYSTLILPRSAGTLTLNLRNKIVVSYVLYGSDGVEQRETQCIYSETHENKRVIHLRMKKGGIYRLRLVGGPVGARTLYDIGNFLILCKSGWHGHLFPVSHEWGLSNLGASIGLTLLQSATSTILAKDDVLDLDFLANSSLKCMVKLVVDGRTITSVLVDGQIGGFQVRLPLPEWMMDSMAALRVYVSSDADGSYTLAASYLVVRDATSSNSSVGNFLASSRTVSRNSQASSTHYFNGYPPSEVGGHNNNDYSKQQHHGHHNGHFDLENAQLGRRPESQASDMTQSSTTSGGSKTSCCTISDPESEISIHM